MKPLNKILVSGIWNFFGIWDLDFGVCRELLTSEVLLTKEVGAWCLVLPAITAL
jgi:hypothetical protein